MATHRQNGFTLLEILVAVTLLGIILPVISATFHTGLGVYKKCMSRTRIFQDTTGSLNLISLDIGRMITVPKSKSRFEPLLFQFVCFNEIELKLETVKYEITGNKLIRTVIPFNGNLGKDDLPKPVELLENISNAGFYYQYEKANDAKEENSNLKDNDNKINIPQSLKLNLKVETPEEMMNFETLFYFPQIKEPQVNEKQEQ